MAEKAVKRCVIICASPECNVSFLREYIRKDDFVICADGGLEHANSAGIVPDLIVGDLDSYQGGIAANIPLIKLDTHKDFSDTMHAANEAVKMRFKRVDLLCAMGGRTDHSLANLSVLSYLLSCGICGRIASDSERIFCAGTGNVEIKECMDKTFSVIPFGCEKAVVSYMSEADYPAQGLTLENSRCMGLSNISRSDTLKVNVELGSVLLIINEK